jgi:hypothetical protein
MAGANNLDNYWNVVVLEVSRKYIYCSSLDSHSLRGAGDCGSDDLPATSMGMAWGLENANIGDSSCNNITEQRIRKGLTIRRSCSCSCSCMCLCLCSCTCCPCLFSADDFELWWYSGPSPKRSASPKISSSPSSGDRRAGAGSSEGRAEMIGGFGSCRCMVM